MEAANAYAPEFMAAYNERFGREPLSDHDAHRPVREDEDLSQIFTLQEDRKISKELTLHYQGNVYLIDPNPETLRLRGRMCRVYADARGRVEVRHEGRSLPFRAFHKLRRVTQADIVSNKRLGAVLPRSRPISEGGTNSASPARRSPFARSARSTPPGPGRMLRPIPEPGPAASSTKWEPEGSPWTPTIRPA